MGKGYRNRNGRDMDSFLTKTPAKTKKSRKGNRPAPKWLVPTIIVLILVGLVVGVSSCIISQNANSPRNNVLVKSRLSNGYSINQNTAKILLWNYGWSYGYYLYSMGSTGSSSSSSMIDQCWNYAYSYANAYFHDVVESFSDRFEQMVAICDYGLENGIEFTEEDQEDAFQDILTNFRSQAKSYYNALSYSTYATGVDDDTQPYFRQYIATILGEGLKNEDFRNAAILEAYYSHILSQIESGYWEATDEEISAELKKNPQNYYSYAALQFETEDAELAGLLKNAADTTDFKKIIVADYVQHNYFTAYNNLLAKDVQTAVQDKDADTIQAALDGQGMTVQTFAALQKTETTEETTEEATEETTEDPLTTEQREWLFNTSRKQYETTVLTEADGSATVLVITNINKDESGTITAVEAAIKTLSQSLTEEEIEDLTHEVYVHMSLVEGTDDETHNEELHSLVETLVDGADSKIPSESEIYYVNAATATETVNTAKEELEEAEDKTSYMTGKKAVQAEGATADANQETMDEALFAVIFGEDTEEGLIQIVETDGGNTKHLIYVSKIVTTEETRKVSYYDYQVTVYSNETEKWLFSNIDPETMTGSREVGETFYGDKKVTYITRAIGLGEEVVRGGYASFSDLEKAQNVAKELEGLTGYDLLEKFSKLESGATVSYSIKKSIASEILSNWFFSSERQANDVEALYQEDENHNVTGPYVGVFLFKTSAGESAARTAIASEKAEEWAKQLVTDGGYKLSEEALSKIENQSTEEETPAEETPAEETPAEETPSEESAA